MRNTIATLLSLVAFPAAGDIDLALPVDCTLGDTCYVQNFVDHDVTPDAQDYRCGFLTYDGHKGTDFALMSLEDQRVGVDVLAAAPGRVTGARDGMVDHRQGTPDAPQVADRECGNGVVIDHGDGWETQYCHLARGTVAVAAGQQVDVGDRLGRIGLSGQTEFPHLHLSLRKDGEVVDPFDADNRLTCDPEGVTESLWAEPLDVPQGGILATGFSDAVPDYDTIKAGRAGARSLQPASPALVAWVYLFGGREGDVVAVEISGPAGSVLSDAQRLDRTQAQLFRAMGRRTPQAGWPEGDYTATFTLIRDDTPLDSQSTQISIAP